MIRLLDIVLALLGLTAGLPVFLLLLLLCGIETRSPLFLQVRVGKDQLRFTLVKFRTMRVGAPQVATHEASARMITPLGRFLRRSKLDELPQLWNVLWGDMSLVGPRPCLASQGKLIEERERRGVFAVRPGITGLAQLRGIDMSTPELLARIDAEMVERLGVASYLRYLSLTMVGKGAGDRVGA